MFFQYTIFLVVDVPSLGYKQIYNILLNDERHNLTIENFPRCSCVYFVTMLVGSLGGPDTYVQCKHVYHVLQLIMLCGFTKNFIHYCMWSWDETQCLLQHSKVLGLQVSQPYFGQV